MKRQQKRYGDWHIQTSRYYSLHNKRQYGYWFSLETIKDREHLDDWLKHIGGKVADFDILNLKKAFDDIFGGLNEPYTKQAIRTRISTILGR
ncbi:MAG: hypothetical protein WCE63_07485 [Acidobacteriaceae bacterium]